MPKLPLRAKEYERSVRAVASTMSETLRNGGAEAGSAAELAQIALNMKPGVQPPIAAALGAPQASLGVLRFAQPSTIGLIVFQLNNSALLERYWLALAAPWNSSEASWSTAWLACESGGIWIRGVAAAEGLGTSRAAAALFFPLPADPCDPAQYSIYGSPPNCNSTSTECEPSDPWAVASPDASSAYSCRCRAGWRASGAGCTPCGSGGCDYIGHYGTTTTRLAVISSQLFGMAVSLVSGIIVFRHRKSKALAISMWKMLEKILLGTLFLYASAGMRYWGPSDGRCLIEAALRELGFITCYGAITLQLYRLLAEFRTRRAHRAVVRDVDLLRILSAMQTGTACYVMALWAVEITCEGACTAPAWHNVTAFAELLVLGTGARMAFAVRNARVPAQERGLLCAALCCEACCVVGWRVLALLHPSLAPEMSEVTAAIRAQLSAWIALLLALAPRLLRLWQHGQALAQERSCRCPHEGFVSVNADRDEQTEPSSEEVRAELKRLYTQLEVLRGQTLRAGNPHVSRRRGGRKPVHRRFSLQKKGSREKALQAKRGGKNNSTSRADEPTEVSRTPEDSVCSNEGPSACVDDPPT